MIKKNVIAMLLAITMLFQGINWDGLSTMQAMEMTEGQPVEEIEAQEQPEKMEESQAAEDAEAQPEESKSKNDEKKPEEDSVEITESLEKESQEKSDVMEAESINHYSLDEMEGEISSLYNGCNLKSKSIYASKTLLVESDTDTFNTFGADNIICFDGIYVLSYDTINQTKKAYKALSEMDTVSRVEVDAVLETGSAEDQEKKGTEGQEEQPSELKKYLLSREPAKETVVAIIDTGYYKDGERGRIIDSGYNVSTSGDGDSTADDNGHGTQMGNIVLGNTPGCVKIMPLKAANSKGKATIMSAYLAIQKAMEQKADTILISLNAKASASSLILADAIREAVGSGMQVVVSAGNSSKDVKEITPSNIEEAIVVGAVDAEGAITPYSNYGDTVDYYTNGVYEGNQGTSYSAAYISSAIAWCMAIGEDYTGIFSDYSVIGKSNIKIISLTNNENNEAAEIVAGDTDNESWHMDGTVQTEYDLREGIKNLDWKNISGDELDLYFGETAPCYVGLFLANLSPNELSLLKDKCNILKSKVEISSLVESGSYQFELDSSENVGFIEYCIDEYNKALGCELSISSWFMNSSEGTFYLSSSDRNKIYKYTFNNLKNKSFTGNSIYSVTSNNASSTSKIYITCVDIKAASSNITFKKPKVEKITVYPNSFRAHEVVYKKASDSSHVKSSKNYEYIDYGTDDGAKYYSMSVSLSNFSTYADGYHLSDSSVKIYKYGTTNLAQYYNWQYTVYESGAAKHAYYSAQSSIPSSNTHFQKNMIGFQDLVRCNATYYYNGVWGKASNNAGNTEWLRDNLKSDVRGTANGIYTTYGNSGAYCDYESTKTLEINTNLLGSCGVVWHTDTPNDSVAQGHSTSAASRTVRSSDTSEIRFMLDINEGTVKYGAGGGSLKSGISNPGDKTISYTTATINLAKVGSYYEKTGYRVDSADTWKIGSTGNTISSASNTSADPLVTALNLKKVDGNSITLTPNWKINTSKLKVNPNEGTWGGKTEVQEFDGNYNTTKSIAVPSRKGYIFNGWTVANTTYGNMESTSTTDTVNYKYGAVNNVTNTITAKWTAIKYKVKYDRNDGKDPKEVGTGSMVESEHEYNKAQNLDKNKFERAYYNFTGWKDQNGNTYKDKEEVVNLTATNGSSVTLYAQWEKKLFNVAYSGNEQTDGVNMLEHNIWQADAYIFRDNLGEDGEKRFEKEEKETRKTESGIEYEVNQKYGFQGWEFSTFFLAGSDFKFKPGESTPASEFYKLAEMSNAISTYVSDNNFYEEVHPLKTALARNSMVTTSGSTPAKEYINVRAAWDACPTIVAEPKDDIDEDDRPRIESNTLFFYEGEKPTKENLIAHLMVTDREDGNLINKLKIKKIIYSSGRFITTDGTNKGGYTMEWEDDIPSDYVFDTYYLEMEKGEELAHMVTYEVTDSAGNTTTEVIPVKVKYNNYPEIEVPEIYYYFKEEANKGTIIKEELISNAEASDIEDGAKIKDKLELVDFDPQVFMMQNVSKAEFDVRYKVTDAFRKTTERKVKAIVVDPDALQAEEPTQYVRFISKKYLDTLEPTSIWWEPENFEYLQRVLSNETAKDTWYFVHEEVVKIKEWILEDGDGSWKRGQADNKEFLRRFSRCRE